MAKVELKQPIVQEISENIKDAQSVVVVDYRGLTVAEDTQLRKALREAGVSYKVYKNTLVNRAIAGTEFESLKESLEGPSAFAISKDDATAPARILAKFAKTAPASASSAGAASVATAPPFSAIWLRTRARLVIGDCKLPSNLERSSSLDGTFAIAFIPFAS